MFSCFMDFRFVSGMVYYGVYLSTPSVGGNLYLNFFLTSIVEVFCLPFIVWSSNKYARDLLFSRLMCLTILISLIGGRNGVVARV